MFRKILLITTCALLSAMPLSAYVEPYCATPAYLTPRSQGEHIERLSAGLGNYLTKPATDTNYGTLSATLAFNRSFNPTALSASLFGDFLQTDRTLTIAGAAANPVANGSTDIHAEWLYLPNTYRGTLYFTPRIQNFTAELDLYYAMDKWMEGLFARINVPIVHTSWDLNMVSVVEQLGVQGMYLGDALDYFYKEKSTTWGEPLNYARMSPEKCLKNGVADIHADLGWKFLIDDKFHLGILLRGVAPTGTRNNGKFIFSPVIGNGHHWELGGGLTSSYLIWNNEEREDLLTIYCDCYITHLFGTKECRVFDLKTKPLSRYMLGVNPDDSTYTPLANLTATRVTVKANVQADLALWLDYTHKNMTVDLGYNFWARSCEKVACPSSCNNCSSCCPNEIATTSSTWGIADLAYNQWTASNATISSLGSGDLSPVYLSMSDLDLRGSATRGMTHSFFGHIAYNWFDKINVPYIGLGGSVEYSHSSGCKPPSACHYSSDKCHNYSCKPCCRTVALSNWALWLKGGVAF